jgi:Protein of unknown function (DUF3800)
MLHFAYPCPGPGATVSKEAELSASIHARCFGGGLLVGDRLVRIAYLDEAGKSKPEEEPYLVVAGVILHADEHWKTLEQHMRGIARRYLPDDPRPLFHAKDIWHGTGKFDRRSPDWPRERRWHLLAELCEIPRDFQLPVILGFNYRDRIQETILKHQPNATKEQILQVSHADTFVKAAISLEAWMRRAAPKETAMIIAEDAPKMKRLLKDAHAGYSNRFAEIGESDKTFHSNHIIETAHFATRAESMPLQLADVCAFVIKRHFMEREDAEGFFNVLRPEIVWFDEDVESLVRPEHP